MFFFNKTEPDLFFDKDMNPIYQMGKKILNKPYNHLYGSTIVRAHKLIKDKYGKNIGYFPHHGVDPYRKSYIDECIEDFREEFFITRHNHFRSFSDIQRVIFAYWAIAVKNSKFEIAPFDSYSECRKSQLVKLAKSKFPLACINSGRKTMPEDIEYMEAILQEKFPKISSFENNKKTINICCVADDKQVEKMLNAVTSILKSKNLNESINIWIIDGGIEENNLNNINALEEKYDCKINLIKIKTASNEDVEPKENYIKACCNVLLSDTIKSDRIIYLDNDVEINQSLLEFYNSDFEDNYVLSSVDITSKDNLPLVGVINCGIMLINLAKLKSLNFKYHNDISDIITTDKIKYVKNTIKMRSNKNTSNSPFGIFNPFDFKGLMRFFGFKKAKK